MDRNFGWSDIARLEKTDQYAVAPRSKNGSQNTTLGINRHRAWGLCYGLLRAIVQFWSGSSSGQPKLNDIVAETPIAIRDATMATLKGEENSPQRFVNRGDRSRRHARAQPV